MVWNYRFYALSNLEDLAFIKKFHRAVCRTRPDSLAWPLPSIIPPGPLSRLEHPVKSVTLIVMKNWIVADPEHLGGSPRVRGTRISVAFILESLAAGLSVADIVDAYPSLTEESVRGALAELARQKELQPA